MLVLGLKAALELGLIGWSSSEGTSARARSVRLLRGRLRKRVWARTALVVAGLLTGAVAWSLPPSPLTAGFALATLVLLVVGEMVERHLFFTAEASPGMPGA